MDGKRNEWPMLEFLVLAGGDGCLRLRIKNDASFAPQKRFHHYVHETPDVTADPTGVGEGGCIYLYGWQKITNMRDATH